LNAKGLIFQSVHKLSKTPKTTSVFFA
jgi:hypothetical protein